MQTSYFLIIPVFIIIALGMTMQLPTVSSDSGSLTGFDAHSPDLTKMSLNIYDTFQQTSTNSTKDLHLEFFDAKNNTLIKNVSFFINATKDGRTLMYDLFYTKTGSMTIKFSPGGDMGKWTVNGTRDPVLGGWMSENEALPVTVSAFTEEGTYHIHLVVLALVYANGLVDQSNPPTFDSWWSVDYKGNISKYDNSTTESIGALSAKIKNASPLQQFKSGIAANDVKCEQSLQLVIKAEDNSPACVKSQTAQKLVERGWGWAMQPINSIKPLLPNRIIGLENDTGIVIFGNRTYYFETPHYTQDAYVNPVQISFHDVVFTLFPSGFKGGLPTNFGGVAANGCSGSYFWTDAKFVDGTHKLLNIFALTTMSQQCLTLPAPTYFSTHTDPLAGLTFYDGKLKLLVSVEDRLQQNNSVFSTPLPTNETIYHDFPQPPGYPIINSTQGIVVNDDAEASNLTGFSVKSPTDLPQGYKVKLIKASKGIPMVTIFVSKYPLTENTTSEDFLWNQHGILITYDQIYPRELENFKQFFSASANKIITINGTLAVVSDISKEYHDGYPYDMWASLIAIKDNDTNIGIRGFFNSDDLIKIATSMLDK